MNNNSYTVSADDALHLNSLGFNVIPVVLAEKSPALPTWKEWQTERQPADWVRSTFAEPREAIAIVTGEGSGNAMVLDFDEKNGVCYEPWKALVPPELHAKLVVETSRSGIGRHAWFRLAHTPDGNDTFARNESRNPLVETRGQGGYCLCAPSPGQRLLQGSFDKLAVLTDDEYAVLVSAARQINRYEEEPRPPRREAPPPPAPGSRRPGDIYNVEGADHFIDKVTELGWQRVPGGSPVELRFRRPGKEEGGCSATLRQSEDGRWWWHVFSTSTELEPVTYNLFSAYAHMACGGDFAEAARQLAGEGFREEAPAEGPGVLVMAVPASARSPKEDVAGKLEKIVARCSTGLIGEICDFTNRTSPRFAPVLAFGGALSFVSFAAGCGRFRSAVGDRPNVFLLNLAPSASGKAFSIRTNARIAHALRMDACVAGNISSGPGLEDSVAAANGSLLVQQDEFHKFEAQLGAKDSALAQGISSALLQFYSASSSHYALRRLSQRNQRQNNAGPGTLVEPHVTLFASGIGEFTFENMTAEAMSDGLLGRFLVLESDRGARAPEAREEDVPRKLLEALHPLCCQAKFTGALPWDDGGKAVRYDDAAWKLRQELIEEADRRYDAVTGDSQEAQRALTGRLAEKAFKVALVLSVGENPAAPVITAKNVQCGWDLAEHSTDRLLSLAETYTATSAFDRLAKRMVKAIRDRRGKASRSEILRDLRVSKSDFEEVLDTLRESGRVSVWQEATGGRPGTVVALAG